jgi:cytochrome P450
MTTASLVSDLVTSFKATARIVIVGASLAGLRAAEALRDEGFTGSLTLIGDEAHEPYDRPPLSKQVLKGWVPAGNTKLPRMRAIDADWRLGVAATGLDRANREVLLANGDKVPYDRLLIATGVRSRQWFNPDEAQLKGLFTLRTCDDAAKLQAALQAGLISRLLHDDGPDGPMPPHEVVPNASLMFIAGHDSTVNTIAHCVLTALRNPGSLDLLRSRPELIPRAIEETLRLQSAVQFFPTRSAIVDIEVDGTIIPAGAAVILLYGAANRDPIRFPNPNQFDPERQNNQHIGWGGGIHSCVGGPLARLEVNLAFENFIHRVDNPRLVEDPPTYRRSPMFRGPQHLWIEFDRITD